MDGMPLMMKLMIHLAVLVAVATEVTRRLAKHTSQGAGHV